MTESRVFALDDELILDIDELFEDAVSIQFTDKGIGYCTSSVCSRYLRNEFLYKHEGPFVCRNCQGPGEIVEERGIPEREEGQLYGEVRIEYGYCSAKGDYQEIAVVRDENMGPDVGTYTAQMPTVASAGRAITIAESLLAALNDGVAREDPYAIPQHRERVLDFGRPLDEVKEWLQEFETRTKNNPFYVRKEDNVVSQCIEEAQ